MLRISRKAAFVLALIAVTTFALAPAAQAFWVCGDGVCSTTGTFPETVDNCPEDCCGANHFAPSLDTLLSTNEVPMSTDQASADRAESLPVVALAAEAR